MHVRYVPGSGLHKDYSSKSSLQEYFLSYWGVSVSAPFFSHFEEAPIVDATLPQHGECCFKVKVTMRASREMARLIHGEGKG